MAANTNPVEGVGLEVRDLKVFHESKAFVENYVI